MHQQNCVLCARGYAGVWPKGEKEKEIRDAWVIEDRQRLRRARRLMYDSSERLEDSELLLLDLDNVVKGLLLNMVLGNSTTLYRVTTKRDTQEGR